MKNLIYIFIFFLINISVVHSSSEMFDEEELLNSFLTLKKEQSIFPQELVDKEKARKWFKYYTEAGREQFQSHLEQGEQYKGVIEALLGSQGLPKDLYYVALIESGFDPLAKSSVGARGIWQFMPATAKKYGLRVDDVVDERLNIYKSTQAAASYLKDLYNIFHDWTLAVAAYNSGEYRVLDAIRRSNTRNYLEICKQGNLPNETRDYVVKLWVARAMSDNAKQYNLTVKRASDEFLIPVKLIGEVELKSLSERIGLNLNDLKRMNPDILQERFTTEASGHLIFLPKTYARLLNFYQQGPRISKVVDPRPLIKMGLTGIETGHKIELSLAPEGKIKVRHMETGREVILDNRFIY